MLFTLWMLLSGVAASQLPSLPGIAPWELKGRFLQQVVGFVDPEVCYPALVNADANGNGIVDADEYVAFVQELGPSGFLEGVTSFEDLPLLLQSTFNFLACLCQTDPDNSCCVGDNAGIATDGAGSSETPTQDEESYLFLVCSLTGSAVDRVLESAAPTGFPTESPTLSPTAPPTTPATARPSATPTEVPTGNPTKTPSQVPTSPPTAKPTKPPTPSPSEKPSKAPTVGPGVPTSEPTSAAPTSISPTLAPTTVGPTTAPAPLETTVLTTYRIGVRNDATQQTYEPQLIDAMDALAPEVLASIPIRRRLRRLKTIDFPTGIDNIVPTECPAGIPTDDVCQVVTATITIIFQPGEPTDRITQEFSEDLNSAISRGELMNALNLEWPDSDVYIIDDTLGLGDDDSTDRTISDGGITGIVIGGVALLAVLGFLLVRRSPPPQEDEVLVPPPKEPEKEITTATSVEPPKPQKVEETPVAAVLGATAPDYGKLEDAMVDNDDALANRSVDSSSNAGSSGWSSSAGVSSLNTGSHDGLSTDGPISAFGTTLAALGRTKAESTPQVKEGGPAGEAPRVTRADLDSAIESGDWAAVGATAALLAAASDSQSYSSNSRAMESQSRASDTTSIDAARAAELDHLVESGDWEGVVLAAAKFEAAESGSASDSRASDSRLSPGASVSSSASKVKRRQELRQEVEELVRRVVPEEIQNVDEMMSQFRGREEELIETLRTMEERAVAQKARQGAQKQAKVQAKLKTPEERKADVTTLLSSIGGPGSPDSAALASVAYQDTESPAVSSRSLGTGQISTSARSLGTGQVMGSAKSKSLGTGTIDTGKKEPSQRDMKQSALEEAIEAGDWEAVGQAAAMLSDHSLASSVETDEIQRLADGLSSAGSGTGSSKDNLSAKAEELEQLIEKGDWTGVVNAAAAAKRASTEETGLESSETDEEARRRRRLQHLKEEEEALAQAQIWEAIAQQTKVEAEPAAVTDEAASAAADWAIGRSLQALVQAEQGDQSTKEEDSSKADTSTKTEEEEEV